MAQWRSYLSHLECTACGLRHDADRLQTVCTACGKVLFARYDLDGVRHAVQPSDFACRRWDMWRYRELLPVRDPSNVISLGEGLTPTASFKARGLAAAVSRAKELGARSIALPTAGNAGSAAAAYAAAGGVGAQPGLPRGVPGADRGEKQG